MLPSSLIPVWRDLGCQSSNPLQEHKDSITGSEQFPSEAWSLSKGTPTRVSNLALGQMMLWTENFPYR